MKQYLDACRYILENGEETNDRTGVGTISTFGDIQLSFNLKDGFPAVTTKKLAWKAMVSELIWFLRGSTDERELAEILYGKDRQFLQDKKTIWTGNALDWKKKQELLNKKNKKSSPFKNNLSFENSWMNSNNENKLFNDSDDKLFSGEPLVKGILKDPNQGKCDRNDLGPVYGAQWRTWKGFNGKVYDQVESVLKSLKNNPSSRRHIINAWNVAELENMALPPCHVMSQFHMSDKNGLSCKMYQRSADFFLGVPFNIASYALLTHIFANMLNIEVNKLVITFGDAHIYKNHIDAVKQQLERSPKKLPTLKINKQIKSLNDIKMDDFELQNYIHDDTIKAEMAV